MTRTFRKVIGIGHKRPFLFNSLGVSRKTSIQSESTAFVHFAVSLGVPINLAHQVSTLLENAAYRGNARTVKMLLQEGADPHVFGNYPIIIATLKDHQDVVDVLIAVGVDVNRRRPRCYSPLSHAVSKGTLETVSKLLSAGAVVTPETVTIARRPGADNAHKLSLLLEHLRKADFDGQ